MAKAERAASSWRERKDNDVKEVLKDMEELKTEALTDELRPKLINETRIMNKCNTMLIAVNDAEPGCRSRLLAQIRSILASQSLGAHSAPTDSAGASPPSSAASSTGDAATGRARLGLAPPCHLYAELKTIEEITSWEVQYHECDTEEQIANVTKKIKIPRAALADLVGCSKSAINELRRALNTAKMSFKQAKIICSCLHLRQQKG